MVKEKIAAIKISYVYGCSYTYTGGQGAWSGDHCKEVSCGDSHMCCECYTFGHFGLLLVRKNEQQHMTIYFLQYCSLLSLLQAVTPVVLDERYQTVLVVFSYLGAAISILCLIVVIITYTLAK